MLIEARADAYFLLDQERKMQLQRNKKNNPEPRREVIDSEKSKEIDAAMNLDINLGDVGKNSESETQDDAQKEPEALPHLTLVRPEATKKFVMKAVEFHSDTSS
jgi:hypothetical protein